MCILLYSQCCTCDKAQVHNIYCLFFVCMYGYGFLSRGFTDWHVILHGGSAWSRTCLLLFWGDSPRNGQILGVCRAPYGGICFLLKHLCSLVLFSMVSISIIMAGNCPVLCCVCRCGLAQYHEGQTTVSCLALTNTLKRLPIRTRSDKFCWLSARFLQLLHRCSLVDWCVGPTQPGQVYFYIFIYFILFIYSNAWQNIVHIGYITV